VSSRPPYSHDRSSVGHHQCGRTRDRTVVQGLGTTFSVGVTGFADTLVSMVQRWRPLQDATNADYVIASATFGDAGLYSSR